LITQILQIAGLMVIAGTKFMYAPAAIYVAGFSFVESVLITAGGGFAGVIAFYRLGDAISRWWVNRFPVKRVKKKFTKKNRGFINFRNKYGLYGLAFVTPCIISIPIGCFLAAKYYGTEKRMISFLFISVVFWSLTLSTFTYLVGPIFA
tara:strand:+ start:1317 stop:1763 length:447 start_codon:yes stop_codon:yes gene_type:complete